MQNTHKWGWALALGLTLWGAQATAAARVEGELPEAKGPVTLHLERAGKEEALSKLGKQAGWNLVLSDVNGPPVTLDVENADAPDVLQAILSDGDYVVSRQGSLVRVAADTVKKDTRESTAESAPTPVAGKRGGDRVVLGNKLVVAEGETVNDVSVTGGSADIYGTVDGDLVATGANVVLHPTGRVTGDTLVVGGRVYVEKGGVLEGEHKVVGGVVSFEDDAHAEAPAKSESLITRTGTKISDMFGNFAFLFVVGALFLAAAPNRMQRLRLAIAARPVASIAHGVLATLAWIAASVVLCVTVIGIPFVAVLSLLLVFALIGALAATTTTAGAALLGHRTENQYVHLALGSALYAVAGVLPWIGGWLQCGAVLAALGVLGTTRMAGLLERKEPTVTPPSQGAYR